MIAVILKFPSLHRSEKKVQWISQYSYDHILYILHYLYLCHIVHIFTDFSHVILHIKFLLSICIKYLLDMPSDKDIINYCTCKPFIQGPNYLFIGSYISKRENFEGWMLSKRENVKIGLISFGYGPYLLNSLDYKAVSYMASYKIVLIYSPNSNSYFFLLSSSSLVIF